MRPVANEVLVPVDRAFRELRRFARPGFTGQARLPIRVKSEAALDVEFGPVQALESQPGTTGGNAIHSPSFRQVFEGGSELTERELRLSEKLNENACRLKLTMNVTAIIGHFKDGTLNTFSLEMVG